VLDNDPAADLHEWYGRYLYFSPEEVDPSECGDRRRRRGMTSRTTTTRRE